MSCIHIVQAGLCLGAAYKIKPVLLLSPFGMDKKSLPGLILKAWQGHEFVYFLGQKMI